MAALDDFRTDVRGWLDTNCPPGARGAFDMMEGPGERNKDMETWLARCIERGFTAPTWPKQYGGGGMAPLEARVLAQEMAQIRARPPTMGMGLSMIGPTLLEFGSEEQRLRHLPAIVRGELRWCQGYSEPSAGSDLAALRTRAEDKGDHFLINGQKIWTSGAQWADWMFALVRTDPDAPKHEGISFVLLDMHQAGVKVRPIRLISGNSPFCETFFTDAIAKKEDLIGRLNQGWTVGKRLLQYERSGQGGLAGGPRRTTGGSEITDLAKQYVGVANGRIGDPAVRETVLRHEIQSKSLALTLQRTAEENRSGKTMGEATSIFKLISATLARDGAELRHTLMGTQGVGWEGDSFKAEELQAMRAWLSTRAFTIFGGTNEIQLNIIAKRVLALPD